MMSRIGSYGDRDARLAGGIGIPVITGHWVERVMYFVINLHSSPPWKLSTHI